MYNRILISLLLAIFLLTGCKDSSTNNSGTTPGNITGFVRVYDTLYQPLSDNSGVRVSLEGTSIKAESDASGKWTLQDVPPGVYTVVLARDHYLTTKYQNQQFAGNGTLLYNLGTSPSPVYPLPILYPNLEIGSFTDDVQFRERDSLVRDSAGKVLKDITLYDSIITKQEMLNLLSKSPLEYNHQGIKTMIFFGTSTEIDPGNPASYLFASIDPYYTDALGNAYIYVRKTALMKAGFTSNQTIYCSAYSFVSLFADGQDILNKWYDPISYKPIYSGFSPYHSEVKSFILP